MRLTLHPQGRHRPRRSTWTAPDREAAAGTAATVRYPQVETWEQARRNYTPPTLSRREWVVSLWSCITRTLAS